MGLCAFSSILTVFSASTLRNLCVSVASLSTTSVKHKDCCQAPTGKTISLLLLLQSASNRWIIRVLLHSFSKPTLCHLSANPPPPTFTAPPCCCLQSCTRPQMSGKASGTVNKLLIDQLKGDSLPVMSFCTEKKIIQPTKNQQTRINLSWIQPWGGKHAWVGVRRNEKGLTVDCRAPHHGSSSVTGTGRDNRWFLLWHKFNGPNHWLKANLHAY